MATRSIQQWVWEEKYRRGDEKTISDTFRRVAKAVASPEEGDNGDWVETYYNVMNDGYFLPGGRILAGAGVESDVTLFNCYVMGTIEDSMSGIMRCLDESARTLRAGGGIGMDFSTLRPRGSPIKGLGSGASSSGPVSFMDLWHTMCGTIMSAGARRGAMMGVLRCDHPDIEEFITAKQTLGRLSNFNVSVGVTDGFMNAVKHNLMWVLSFGGETHKTLPARDLWEKIMRSTYETADPGVLFIDRANAFNPLRDIEKFATTNPCGEQWLPPYGACLLGSVNLARMVSSHGRFDWDVLEETVGVGVRFLDNVIEISQFPLQQQMDEAQAKRRIGIGVTGFADALIMLGLRYGSEDAFGFADRVGRTLASSALTASKGLAETKGNYPLWQPEHGPRRRNSHLLSIQPTGTVSLLAGNVSSGIEPVYDWQYTRRVLRPDGGHDVIECQDWAYARCREEKADSSVWVTMADMKPIDHIRMVEAFAKHIDSGISKTVNCPADISFEEFRGIYEDAFARGLKGCTTYRPVDGRPSVLVRDEDRKQAVKPDDETNVVRIAEKLDRPDVLKGRTYKLKPSGDEFAYYVTINDVEISGRRRPFEVFIATKQVDANPWTTALSLMISGVFRKGGDISFVHEELMQVFSPRGGYYAEGKYVPSVCAGIGHVIKRHMEDIGFSSKDGGVVALAQGKHCPKCQTGALIPQEGCLVCNSCTYSKCG